MTAARWCFGALLAACSGPTDPDTDRQVTQPPPQPTTEWHQDADGDGFGDPAVVVRAPVVPDGHVADATDCDDTDATAFPGAYDRPNDGVDQDCDGIDDNCTNAVVAEGDLTLFGDSAEATAESFCASAAEITGVLTIEKTTLKNLSSLSCMCEAQGVVIQDNPDLLDISGLSSVALRDVTGVFTVQRNASLPSVTGPRLLEEVAVEIRDNPSLTSIVGFDGLLRAHAITITASPKLTTLTAFDNVSTVLRLTLQDLGISDLSSFDSVQTVDELALSDLPALTDLQGLSSLTEVGDLLILGTPVESLAGMDAIKQLHTLIAESTSLSSLADLNSLSLIHTVKLDDSQLESLDGLQALRTIDTLIITNNGELTDLTAAHSITEIISLLQVTDNPSMPKGAAQALVDAIGDANIGSYQIQ